MTILGGVVMTVGIALSLLSAVGVWRFPTALARMHAATKSASLGLSLVVLGAGIASSSPGIVGIGVLLRESIRDHEHIRSSQHGRGERLRVRLHHVAVAPQQARQLPLDAL